MVLTQNERKFSYKQPRKEASIKVVSKFNISSGKSVLLSQAEGITEQIFLQKFPIFY